MSPTALSQTAQHDTPIAAIVGPTASGKTGLAVRLAERGLPIEVVCCDALQLVRDLDAATAKPSAQERAAVVHHLVDSTPPTIATDAGRFAEMADQAIADIAARGRWPVLVGGTGLYHRAVVRGLAQLPTSSPEIRADLEREAARDGLPAMHDRLREVDPAYAALTPAANRQRVLRALEVYRLSGRPFSAFHAAHASAPDRYRCATIVLTPEREGHLAHIEKRATLMAPNLLREVKQLLAAGLAPDAPGMQALGYRQAAEMISAGRTDAAALVQILTIGHRRYAKRQRTWFRKTTAALRVEDVDAETDAVAEVLQAWFSSSAS
ncbi:MAG: tRNA (adenosine(37)-N6)-dimethylallyltransferase MiaA [Myxococcales bacterium]|nr:tRNA (adenosine(37)-N6)-dimethylallyltransferase MiaA [Myxococcales bacterium]